MVTYIVLFFLLASLSFTDCIYIPALYKKLLLFLGGTSVFLILWAFASLRWKTGTDWDSYYDAFSYFSEIYAVNFEPGYVLILSIIREYTASYTVFLAIFSFFCIFLKFSFFFKYHKEFFFTLIFLYYCYYFADIFAVRQSLSISLTLFSTIFIIKRKPVLFILFVSLATSIHTSSALYYFAYYLYWRNISDKTFYYLIAFCIFFGLIGIGGVILNLFLKALGVEGYVAIKINNYLNEDNALNTNNNPLIMYLLGIIKRLLFIPLFVYVKNKYREGETHFQGYFNLYMVGNVIYFLFAKDLAVFARASVPFLFFEIMLLAYVLYYHRKSKKIIVFLFVVVMFFSWSRLNALINSYYDLYVPYNTIFDKKIERNLE